MKFSCQQSVLNNAITNVARAVPQKSPIPALEGIKLSLNKKELELTGYDLEFGIQTKIIVDSDDISDYVLNAHLFCEIIRKMPQGIITVEIDSEYKTVITGESAEYKIIALPADDYPSVPDYDSGDNFILPQPLLRNMINQTIFAVAVVDTKPVLMGELFDINDHIFNLAAIDGYRLAVRTENIETDNHYHFVVKAKTLSEVSKLLSDNDDDKVTVHVSKKHVAFEISGYMVISRLLEGEFNNYRGAIPDKFQTEVIISTRNLIESLERCILLIQEKTNSSVRCNFNEGKIKLTCATELGRLNDEFDTDISGSPVEIGFNCRFLLDALKASESDKVKLQLNGALSPMKITPIQGNSYTFLVLPMRLRN